MQNAGFFVSKFALVIVAQFMVILIITLLCSFELFDPLMCKHVKTKAIWAGVTSPVDATISTQISKQLSEVQFCTI